MLNWKCREIGVSFVCLLHCTTAFKNCSTGKTVMVNCRGAERQEATALTELVDMLSLMRLRRSGSETAKIMSEHIPRRDRWSDHFRWTKDWHLIGRTPTGRATITALGMNRPAIIKIRRALAMLDRLGH